MRSNISASDPLHGFGYEAFWKGDESPGTQYSEYYAVPHSHNAWIELSIALGVPAAVLMFGIMLVTMGRGIFMARYSNELGGATLIILMVFVTLTISMSEPVFLEKHSFYAILLVTTIGAARALTASLRSGHEANADPYAMDDRGMPASGTSMRRAPGMG